VPTQLPAVLARADGSGRREPPHCAARCGWPGRLCRAPAASDGRRPPQPRPPRPRGDGAVPVHRAPGVLALAGRPPRLHARGRPGDAGGGAGGFAQAGPEAPCCCECPRKLDRACLPAPPPLPLPSIAASAGCSQGRGEGGRRRRLRCCCCHDRWRRGSSSRRPSPCEQRRHRRGLQAHDVRCRALHCAHVAGAGTHPCAGACRRRRRCWWSQ